MRRSPSARAEASGKSTDAIVSGHSPTPLRVRREENVSTTGNARRALKSVYGQCMKVFTGLSLVSLAVVLVLVLSGQLSQAESLLSPQGADTAENAVRSNVGRAQTAGVQQSFAALYKQARLAQLSEEAGSARELTRELAANEPQTGVGRPVSEGGTVVRLPRDDVEFCARQSGGRVFTCARGVLGTGGKLRWGHGYDLRSARKATVDGSSSAIPKGAGASEGLEGEGAGSTGGNILDRARESAGQQSE